MSDEPERINELLAEFDRFVATTTGRTVYIARARPADAALLRGFYEHLSDTSTYYRFFGIRPAITDDHLAAIVDTNRLDHITLLAWMSGVVVGVGEMHVHADRSEAEVAFAVSDRHHAEGIATILLEDLAVIAVNLDVSRLTAQTLSGNQAMQIVFRTAGFAQKQRFDGGVVDVVCELDDLTSLAAAAMMRERCAARAALSSLFAPGHVALIEDIGHPSLLAVRSRGAFGALFDGRLSFVDGSVIDGSWNPRGIPLEQVRSTDDTSDLAVVMTAAAADIVPALEACSQARIRTAAIMTDDPAGALASMGDPRALSHRLDMRVLGPATHLAVPSGGILSAVVPRQLRLGRVAAVMCRSDGREVNRLVEDLAVRQIGASAVIAMVPESDIDVAELLMWWSLDPGTGVVILSCDDLPDGRRFHHAARVASRSKPVVVLADRDSPSSSIAAGEAGLIRVKTRRQLVDAAAFFGVAPPLAGSRVVAIATQPAERAARVAIGSVPLERAVLSPRLVRCLHGVTDVTVEPGVARIDRALSPMVRRLAQMIVRSGEADAVVHLGQDGVTISMVDAQQPEHPHVITLSEGGTLGNPWSRAFGVLAVARGWTRWREHDAASETPEVLSRHPLRP